MTLTEWTFRSRDVARGDSHSASLGSAGIPAVHTGGLKEPGHSPAMMQSLRGAAGPNENGCAAQWETKAGLVHFWVLLLGFICCGWGERALGEGKEAGAGSDLWWSLKPLSQPPLPAVKQAGWARTPIDSFVLAKLEEKKLKPSGEADRRTWLRRVTFDLTGLPPTPGETAEFLRDGRPEAHLKVVDRLLSKPAYGERWARHWLDIVHYADTHGHDQDRPRPNSWPYRDYVIRSFNEDKPYARFVQEQLAGDVLFPDQPDGVIATGFIATGPWDESSQMHIMADTVDKKIAQNLDRDDMVMTAMSTFASTTVHCARCHDHKFDPVTQEEYYGLQAVFAGVDRADRPFDQDAATHQLRQQLLKERTALEIRQQSLADIRLSEDLERAIREGQREWEKRVRPEDSTEPEFMPGGIGRVPAEIIAIVQRPEAERPAEQSAAVAAFYRSVSPELQKALAHLDARLAALPAPRFVYAAASNFKPEGKFTPAKVPRPIYLLRRGEVTRPAGAVEPKAPAMLPGLPPELKLSQLHDEGERRAALARWVTDPRNVLTWRSIANRIWHYHFGRGLVDTPNDFGQMGSLPTHPELLDWLAVWVRDGGSLKELHRMIVLSATYRQSSKHDPEMASVDSGNAYLWRMNRTRLDAESLRDAVLWITGKMDWTMGGPSVKQFLFEDPNPGQTPNVDYARFDVDSPSSFRRSIYRWIFRTLPDPFMDTMDCPDSSQLTPSRNSSVTALQALAMLNNDFIVRQSEHFAARLERMASNVPDQISTAYELALGRDPTPGEREALAQYATRHGLANACRLLLNSNEFLFVN